MEVSAKETTFSPGVGRFMPPNNPLREVFPCEVREKWRKCAPTPEELSFRLSVLEACGPYPSDTRKASRVRFLRAKKAAWETYLFAAWACGMFEGDKGKDLRGRLRDTDDNNFRSAMAECMTCWFIAGRMKLPVDPYAPGRNGKNLEMQVDIGGKKIGVEVKAPFREMPKSTCGWTGNDADKIEECMEAANKQFSDDRPNLLVIVPHLRIQPFMDRNDLIRAAYGHNKIICPLYPQTGGAAGPSKLKFSPEGKFMNPIKPDGFPAYTRISAILCIEERLMERCSYSEDNEKWIDHNILVLHNPYAKHLLSPEAWNEFPQFVHMNGKMKWTDGYEIAV